MKPEIPVLIPSIFRPFPQIRSAVSTRRGGVSPEPLSMNLSFNIGDARDNVLRNRELFFLQLEVDPSQVSYSRQVHSSNVEIVTEAGDVTDCDALITNEVDLALAITIADCTPILMYAPDRNIIAAVHAGWKGTALGIVGCTVQKMVDQYSCSPALMKAYIGPAAGACCYEVGGDVTSRFPGEVIRQRGKKQFLDLKAANQLQLFGKGLADENIEVSPECTICNAFLFHSYRRDCEQSGRMMACIVMKAVAKS